MFRTSRMVFFLGPDKTKKMTTHSHPYHTTNTSNEETGAQHQGAHGFSFADGAAAAAAPVGEGVVAGTSGLRLSIDMNSLNRTAQTAEDERRQKRREQNKLAAERYRNKKRESSESLAKIIKDLQDTNIALKAKLRMMEDRREYWVHAIRNIKTNCPDCNDMDSGVKEEFDASHHHCQQSPVFTEEQSEPLCLTTSTRHY